ncbi:conserved hypothetical protein [Leishmania major strain Friedlin]|uniref:Opioid growth factor receptor (OGFr) conserved domain-containing protein n=1 Tax=Leishmania major TaxID=5664 RepID=Q4Q9A3_LEIMA|nr:conserved hypothetical protein [Leishmania major strain Friedlin]CAG9576406.1 hypothetical_protein_-_conserved [Leishmania major strain Friedlin]CAJ04979.1 conserved hypothetical protein [Leishmania major strain Friedlin]|eukprot:XP_001684095.1 conserved hypothetical protein [Leishmania major strain Friedlin]
MELHQQQQHCCEASTADEAVEGDGQRRTDAAEHHPSVRFYRGMWSLTQLTDPIFDDVISSTDGSNGDKAVSAPASETPAEVPSGSPSPLSRVSPLSVVGLHQTLLPPAAVNGLGDVADENYAVQLASSNGLEFLRLHWHILLPLLFPCCRWGDEAGAIDPTVSCSGRDNSSGQCSSHVQQDFSGSEEGASSPVESSCSASELYELLLRRPLLESDLAIVREPGLMDRVYYSYVVLLRFFGWRVHEEERGLLDRHRAWQERYALLELYRASTTAAATTQLATGPTAAGPCSHVDGDDFEGNNVHQARHACPRPPPTYHSFNFYESGVPRVLRSLLDIGFLRLAVRLVEFLLEEMSYGRLLFLLPLVEVTLLPILVQQPHVESSHKTRLKKRLYRLTHSDSD